MTTFQSALLAGRHGQCSPNSEHTVTAEIDSFEKVSQEFDPSDLSYIRTIQDLFSSKSWLELWYITWNLDGISGSSRNCMVSFSWCARTIKQTEVDPEQIISQIFPGWSHFFNIYPKTLCYVERSVSRHKNILFDNWRGFHFDKFKIHIIIQCVKVPNFFNI